MEVTCLCCKKVLKDKAYPVKIPDNNYIRQHWLAVMKMDVKKNINKIDKQNYLCSTHFDEEDILGKTLNETILHYEALPKPLKFKAKKFINEEKVNRIKEQQVKESLLGEEMLPKNGWRQLPSEIKFIILSFLCKNDLEKYQLVSSEWNKIILGSSNTFPLRQVETLYRQGDYCFLTLPGFSKCFKLDSYMPPSLTTCIISKLVIDRDSYNLVQDHINELEKMQQDIGEKLNVITVRYGKGKEEEDRTFLKCQEKLFGKLLTAHQVELIFTDTIFMEIMNEPKILDKSLLPLRVKFTSFPDFGNQQILDVKVLEHFIQNRNDIGRSYKIEALKHNENFAKEYLKVFTNISNPGKLFRKITIGKYKRDKEGILANIAYVKSLSNFRAFEKSRAHYKVQCYELKREDDWIFLCTHDTFYYTISYKVYKTHFN